MSESPAMESSQNDVVESLPEPQQEQAISIIGDVLGTEADVADERSEAKEVHVSVKEEEEEREEEEEEEKAEEKTENTEKAEEEQMDEEHKEEKKDEEQSEEEEEEKEEEEEENEETKVESVEESMEETPEETPAEQLPAETTTDEVDIPKAKAAESKDGGKKTHKRLDENDSLVTVRLSEPPALTIDTTAAEQSKDDPTTATLWSAQKSATMPTVDEDDETDDVDWEQLQRTEDQESSGKPSTENTAMLLARLEQENTKIATNPKSVKVHGPELQPQTQSPRRPRPPSMAQLREMVHGPTPSALRYSMLPPPPMTDLEFYAALVQDYHQTAARLPTLLANKIRKGIPPPLRGVVWQGMTGATRDSDLAARFDRFCVATSPYENIIGKDLGRSFPGVEMFRDPDGDGQRMLGRVLKSYSLHDRRIGYCQGLAFLVGPLLMHMPDREAFCVLVKLMENYDLRSSYTPDLAGLHVRIYQFRELLRAALPDLSAHLDELQVDPAAYVSQWFLSFFAVTCPLPMLFRMFDVVFAEGAAETVMRVALSLMMKNQERLLGCAELEDAIQLLLSRGLWDCYHYNADEFVHDFLSLSSVVSRDRLALLEQAYREAQIANTNQTGCANVDRSSAIATAASRFLGRLWSSSSSLSLSSPPTATPATFPSSFLLSSASSANTSSSDASTNPLSPPASHNGSLSGGLSSGLSAPPSRPLSMLRRSASKQSLASTVNSMEATSASIATSSSSSTASSSSSTASSSSSTASSSSSVLSTASTEATSLSRDSAAESNTSTKSNSVSHTARTGSSPGAKQSESERYLNSQIEDLLTALSDLQRQHAVLADQLQQEREDRDEDRKAVQTFLRTLGEKTSEQSADSEESTPAISNDDLQSLLEPVQARFGADSKEQPVAQTKAQMRDEVARAKEQLANEVAKGRERNRREYELEQEISTMKEQLRESHTHGRNLYQEKQRLERLVHDMRRGKNEFAEGVVTSDTANDWFNRVTGNVMVSGSSSSNGGLRELKLVRSRSTPTQALISGVLPLPGAGASSKRSSSLTVRGSERASSIFGGPAPSEPEYEPPAPVYTVPVPVAAPTPTNTSTSNAADTTGTADTADASNASNTEQSDALVLELIQAKTSEAVARQETEEVKQKLESLRKALGLSSSDLTSILHIASTPGSSMAPGSAGSAAATAAMGMLGRLTSSSDSNSNHNGAKSTAVQAAPATTAAPASTGVGSFFGWRR